MTWRAIMASFFLFFFFSPHSHLYTNDWIVQWKIPLSFEKDVCIVKDNVMYFFFFFFKLKEFKVFLSLLSSFQLQYLSTATRGHCWTLCQHLKPERSGLFLSFFLIQPPHRGVRGQAKLPGASCLRMFLYFRNTKVESLTCYTCLTNFTLFLWWLDDQGIYKEVEDGLWALFLALVTPATINLRPSPYASKFFPSLI